MENPFQQFATSTQEENPFAQFVTPQAENPFAQFVQKEEPQVAVPQAEQAPAPSTEAVAPEEKGFISNITGSVPKSVLNLKQALVNMTLPDLIALKEVSQKEYGLNYENAPEAKREELLRRDDVINQKLATLVEYGAEAKALEKQYGLTPIKQKFEELRKDPEYEKAGTFEQFKRIGSVLLDNPASIPSYLATVTLETLPTSLATIAPAILTRYAGFSPNVSATVGGLGSYMTEFGGNYMDLRQNGMPHEEAWEKAGIKSGIIGLLDAASFKSAGLAAEKIFGQAQKSAITNGLKVAGKEAAIQAAYGGGGEYLGTEVINEKVDPIAVLEEMAAEVSGAPAKAFSTYRQATQPEPIAQPKVEPTVGTAAEPTAEKPSFDEYGYLDTPEYQDKSEKYLAEADKYKEINDKIDQLEDGSPEKDEAVKEALDYFNKNLKPLLNDLDNIRNDWTKQTTPEEKVTPEEKPLTDKDVLWLDEVKPEAKPEEAPAPTQAPEKIIVPESDFQDNQAIFDALDIKPGIEETNEKLSRAEPTFTEENIQQPVEAGRVEPTLTEEIAPPVEEVKQTPPKLIPPEDLKLKKGRNEQVVLAARELAAGNITKEQYDQYVDAYAPISTVPNPEPLLNQDSMFDILTTKLGKNNKKPEFVDAPIEDGARVGLRMDIPALEWGKANGENGSVVSIHEGRDPELKTQGKNISYKAAGVVDNPVFAVRSEERAFGIAQNLPGRAGEKTPQQTIEGEWVNMPPEQVYQEIQANLNNPEWTQVSLDPLRHSFFYDRATRQPVLSADRVLQAGRFVLAKNVKYGDRQDFLYNVPTERQSTESAEERSPYQIRKETIARYASLKQSLSAIQRRFVKDKSKPFDADNYKYLYEQAQNLKQEIQASKQPRTTPADFLARASKELADNRISQDVFDVINNLYQKNPDLLNGLRLSVKRGEKIFQPSGQFFPLTKIVTLYKGTEGVLNPSTIRHELVHSLEQMMSKEAQAALVDAWGKALLKATRKAKTNKEKQFFVNVGKFIDDPTNTTMQAAISSMPDYSYYQYINPSEYWAVNAEKLMESYLGSAWQRFKNSVRGLFEALKSVFGFDNKSAIYKAFNGVLNPDRSAPMLVDYVDMVGKMIPTYNIPKNYKGQPAPTAAFTAPEETGKNEFVRNYINDKVYIEKTLEKIRETNQPISEKLEAYLKEKLASSRAAFQHKKFKTQEVDPILKDMKRLKISDDQLSEFLLASHAQERNEYIASINPNLPDGGSSMDTQEAKDYMDSLSPKRKADLQSVANQVYKIINGTGDLYVASGDHKASTVQGWRKLFKNYVPLNRTEEDFSTGSFGLGGAGYNVAGSPIKKTTGSKSRQVKSILENVIHQRDNAIDRGERIRVGNALMGLALQFPNPKFWLPIMPSAIKNQKAAAAQLAALGTDGSVINNLMSQPTVPVVNPKTGLVEYVANPAGLYGSNVFHTRINGENAYIVFNANEPSAKLMAESLNKMSPEEIGKALSVFGKGTKAFSSLMTQYNPVWGLLVNLPRDTIFSFINAFTLPIGEKKFNFIMKVIPAMIGSWNALRNERQGIPVDGKYAKAFEEMSEAGGRTLYRDSFVNMQKDGEFLEKEMARLNRGNLKKVAYGIVNLMGDFNDALESGFRVAAYMTARDLDLSKDQAANIAKEITVNFDRRGAKTRRASMLYSFLNANIQGNLQVSRILRSKQGKAIATSLFGFGVTQALMLSAAGFDDDDIPEYIKDRYFIIPLGAGKAYQKIPMPPGLSLITNLGRISTEMALDTVQGKDAQFGKKVPQFLASTISSFSPFGATTENLLLAPVPTTLRPPAAVVMNKDQFGRPISREDTRAQPSPGYLRSSQAASEFGNLAAYIINKVTFGSDFEKGYASPTGNDIDYIVKQYTPGIFKEIRDAAKFAIDSTRGDVVNVGQVPLLNKLVGSAADTTNDSRKFYDNVAQVNKHYYNYKNSLSNDNDVAADDILNRHPEVELNGFANSVVKQIARLNKEKMRITKEGGSRSEIQEIERDKLELMREFNSQFKEVRTGR